MSLLVPAQSQGVHVFAVSDIDGPGPEHQTFLSRLNNPADLDTTLPTLFNAPNLDPAGAEVFALSDIETLGLRGYLAEGYDIPPEAMLAEAARLDALGGDVILLTSRATGSAGMTLRPAPHIRHIISLTPLLPDVTPRAAFPVDLTRPPVDPAQGLRPRMPSWLSFLILALVLAIGAIVLL